MICRPSILWAQLLLLPMMVSSFATTGTRSGSTSTRPLRSSRLRQVVDDFERPTIGSIGLEEDLNDNDEYDGGINVLFSEDDVMDIPEAQARGNELQKRRLDHLKPQSKKKFGVKENSKTSVASSDVTKRKESPKDKKRRMLMYFEEKQREKKRVSKIQRPLKFDERVPLSAYIPGMELTGKVISLTNFGAYVDVGTVCDGLLHISQITRDFFVEHPRQVLTPGDEVMVKVRSTNPDLKKLHLTMLDQTQEDLLADKKDSEDRTTLCNVDVDDELWGELKRVTDFGAYVEVGAEVDGFLHFMDHPLWDDNMHPSEFMKTGQRVRVWVADVDMAKRRIRLTGNRPASLPGPRSEFRTR